MMAVSSKVVACNRAGEYEISGSPTASYGKSMNQHPGLLQHPAFFQAEWNPDRQLIIRTVFLILAPF
jgi:hypothetical protein